MAGERKESEGKENSETLQPLSAAFSLHRASSAMVTAEHWESSIDAPPGQPMRLCPDLGYLGSQRAVQAVQAVQVRTGND